MAVHTHNWDGDQAKAPGANSCQITYENGDIIFDTSKTNAETDLNLLFPAGSLIRAIFVFLCGDTLLGGSTPGHGWTFVPNTYVGTGTTIGGGTAGRFGFSAPNLPDVNGVVTYKYLMYDFSVSGQISQYMYETYPQSASTPTNFAVGSNIVHALAPMSSGVAQVGGTIWLGASARHIVMVGHYSGNYSNFGGCFEMTRTSVLDIATSYPKHCALSSMLGYTGVGSSSFGIPVAVCRNNGGIATNATSGVMTDYNSQGFGVVSGGIMPTAVDARTARPVASNIHIHGASRTLFQGTIINAIAITSGWGALIGDDIQIPVLAKSDYGNEKFYDRDGVITSYWLVGCAATSVNSAIRLAIPK